MKLDIKRIGHHLGLGVIAGLVVGSIAMSVVSQVILGPGQTNATLIKIWAFLFVVFFIVGVLYSIGSGLPDDPKNKR